MCPCWNLQSLYPPLATNEFDKRVAATEEEAEHAQPIGYQDDGTIAENVQLQFSQRHNETFCRYKLLTNFNIYDS